VWTQFSSLSLGSPALYEPGEGRFRTRTGALHVIGTVLNSATSAGIARALVSYVGPASGFRFYGSRRRFSNQGPAVRSVFAERLKARLRVRRGLSPQLNRLLVSGQWPLDSDSEEQSSRQPSATRATVDLNSGSAPARILLVPVSSIAGIVLDENGEPIAGPLSRALP